MNWFSLFRRECGHIAKGVLYFVFFITVALFYFTQFYGAVENDIMEYRRSAAGGNAFPYGYTVNPLIEPVPGQDNYGFVRAEIPEQIMPVVTSALCREYIENNYITYPIGFYKNVRLNEEQQSRVAEILTEITGLSPDALWKIDSDAQQKALVQGPDGGMIFMDGQRDYQEIPIQVSYAEFQERMAEVDRMLGGGSSYSASELSTSSSRPVTYQERLDEYEKSLEEGGITGPYARLFCDYMGIVLGLFSVFVPVSFLLRDRRAHMRELIESRSCGTVKLVAARYLACVVMILLPVLILSLIPLVQLAAFGWEQGLPVQLLAFARYIFFWLLPTVMVCVSVGFFFTILTDTPLAIAIQFIWSFADVFMGGGIEGGVYETDLIIRHNSLGNLQLMQNAMQELISNRFIYTGAALLLLVASMVLYEWKRRGSLDVYSGLQKILGHFRSPAPAHSGS